MEIDTHLMVVEDSPTQALEIQYFLEEHGYKVSLAEDGEQAFAMLKDFTPTIVISDIVMPRMNGYELCTKIKENDRLKDIPVILLTSLSKPEDVIKGLVCGANNFLVKPFDKKLLLSRIRYILINQEMRKTTTSQAGIEIFFREKKYFLSSERMQMIDLLLSTYEVAIQKNQDFEKANQELEQIKNELEKRVQERTKDLQKRTHDLGERLKELNCLYSVSELIEKGISIEMTIKEIVNIISFAWQYPEISWARIIFEGQEFKSNNFKETVWRQTSEIIVLEKKVGTVEVGYLEERSEEHEGPFLKEERDLINEIAERIGRFIERNQTEKQKQELESQLQQAQKMESVGRLAGGVAHDYNNALSVIMGYAELAMADIDPTGSLHDDLNQILMASKRATNITKQLLAFARKQTIAPMVLDLNKNMENMLKMLKRLIGEDIDLAWLPAKDLWSVKIDPTQIDQILANLCVNARDAIKGVGKITIETEKKVLDKSYCQDHAEFVPGKFVLLIISDNGCGMDKKIQANIFEPFFTTKDVDKGTGLGLSTVYGIVKQNKGFINVYSEPGKGTAVKIYLPMHEGKAVDLQKKSMPRIPQGGGETILLVEDSLPILKLAKKILENLGYKVLDADTPKKAIELAKEHIGGIQLLVSDVIMPEMNGLELANNLQTLYPDSKRLFMSGYTANVIARHGVLDQGVHFIQKPFSKNDLAQIIRKILDE